MHLRLLFLLLLLLLSLPLAAQQSSPSEHASSLPSHPSCLTPRLLQQQGRVSARNRESDRSDGVAGNEVKAPGAVARETRQRNIVSPSGYFRVHFDQSGRHAVAAKDANGNAIPDYIDSVAFYMDYAWQIQVVEMGYKAPGDKGAQGPEIDVVVSELGVSAYGYAYPEFDNEISSSPLRITGYLVLDNDYAGFPTPGIDGLRVTTAHEFQHIIQFASYRVEVDQLSLYEATATWFEKVVHPTLRDYRNYTDLFLKRPQIYPFSTHEVENLGTGYGSVLYLIYLSERIGRDVVRRIWEEFEIEVRSFNAIDNALLAESDLDLERSWCEYARWCYRTGRRAPSDSSMFDEAASLPTMETTGRFMFDGSAPLEIPNELQPLAFGVERVLIGGASSAIDTVDFLIVNARPDIGRGGPQLPHESFVLTLRSTAAAGFIPLTGRGTTIGYYRFGSSSPYYCVSPLGTGISGVSAVESDVDPAPLAPGSSRRPEGRSRPSINLQGE